MSDTKRPKPSTLAAANRWLIANHAKVQTFAAANTMRLIGKPSLGKPKPRKPKPDVAERIVLRQFNYDGWASDALNTNGRQRALRAFRSLDRSADTARLRDVAKAIRAALRAHGKRAFTDGWKARNHRTYSQCKAYHDLARPYGIDPRNLP